MSLKRLVIICTLSSFLSGCAGLYGTQPPAPVYGGLPSIPKPAPGPQQKPKPSKSIVKTQPLKDFSIVMPEPMAPSQPSTIEALEPSLPPPPAPSELTPFEPIEATVVLSPAVGALVSAADQTSQAGDLESAAASIERAVRIEPRNATLFYKLALLRLKQSKPRLAEDLAKKSALLAATDSTLKRHCWLLIAHARETQQDFAGAKAARAKAAGF